MFKNDYILFRKKTLKILITFQIRSLQINKYTKNID